MLPAKVTAESTNVLVLMLLFALGPLHATVILPAGARSTLET
jgi:hypothetical protein